VPAFFWALELVRDEGNSRLEPEQRDVVLRQFLPQRLREIGLIARCDARGDSVIQIAPPLISDEAVLDEMTEKLSIVITDASRELDRLALASATD
jgi:4-aminobutyrate aminotransferase-like enzyme